MTMMMIGSSVKAVWHLYLKPTPEYVSLSLCNLLRLLPCAPSHYTQARVCLVFRRLPPLSCTGRIVKGSNYSLGSPSPVRFDSLRRQLRRNPWRSRLMLDAELKDLLVKKRTHPLHWVSIIFCLSFVLFWQCFDRNIHLPSTPYSKGQVWFLSGFSGFLLVQKHACVNMWPYNELATHPECPLPSPDDSRHRLQLSPVHPVFGTKWVKKMDGLWNSGNISFQNHL